MALTRLPFLVLLMVIGAVAMLVPSVHALSLDDFRIARTFLYGFILLGVLSLLLGLALFDREPDVSPQSAILSLLGAFALLPILFAIPFMTLAPQTSFFEAWFEMVSSFTTTGATQYDSPFLLQPSLHLWRAMVGWLGGLLIWVAALAIFAPLNLGGFEVSTAGRGSETFAHAGQRLDMSARLTRFALTLVPIYVGLTGALWVLLLIGGEVPFVALCHAMSILATSGITPLGGFEQAESGFLGEVIVFAFFAFALSRRTFWRSPTFEDRQNLAEDREIRLAVTIVLVLTLLLFLRHWLGAIEEEQVEMGDGESLSALWGALFTVTSFLTTTGFESRAWVAASSWSGLETPGLLLLGVALIGGGIATTAGGVKLLRTYALYKHGQRELRRLVLPNSVGGAGSEARRIRRQGAYIAWVFFMLFALSVAAVMVLLSLTGVSFEDSMVLTIAALSNTGPVATVAAEAPVSYGALPDFAKLILAAAMILGRLEALALIAVLNPEFWQR